MLCCCLENHNAVIILKISKKKKRPKRNKLHLDNVNINPQFCNHCCFCYLGHHSSCCVMSCYGNFNYWHTWYISKNISKSDFVWHNKGSASRKILGKKNCQLLKGMDEHTYIIFVLTFLICIFQSWLYYGPTTIFKHSWYCGELVISVLNSTLASFQTGNWCKSLFSTYLFPVEVQLQVLLGGGHIPQKHLSVVALFKEMLQVSHTRTSHEKEHMKLLWCTETLP